MPPRSSADTPRWKAVLDKHRRHVELSPGAGKDAQNYALAVIADIEADFVHDSPRSEKAPSEYERLERLKVEAERWLASLNERWGDKDLLFHASRGIRNLIDQAALAPRTETRPISEVSVPLAEAINTPCPHCGKRPVEAIEAPICPTTGNPCGTDTVFKGQECPGGGPCKKKGRT